jgi:Na+-driven multidrug efflux pump
MMLGTKPELMSRSLLYVRIICIGIPASSVYNFGAAILRATGNSRIPLIILASSGMVNVLLNLFFVIVCDMSVAGVAIATISSQYLSAAAVTVYLMTRKGKSYQLIPSMLGIKASHLKRILLIGIPSGVQMAMYTIGNMLLASAVNTFPTEIVTSASIASNIDSIMLQSIACYGHACLTFSGQNYGAKKPERMKKVLLYTTLQAIVMGFISATLLTLCSDLLISLYLPADAQGREAIVLGVKTIIGVMLYSYIINAVDSTFNAVTKSLGHTFVTMTSGIICICGVRAIWILGIFPHIGTLRSVYLVYPISYTISTVATIVAFLIIFGRANREMLAERAALAKAAALHGATEETTEINEEATESAEN